MRKTITYTNDVIKIQENNSAYSEFSIRLTIGDLIEFENEDDAVAKLNQNTLKIAIVYSSPL